MSATTVLDGRVKHANATTWYDNYPMEQLFTQTFNVTWTQGFNGSAVRLDSATYGNHPRSGDTVNFHGFFGFDRPAMQAFVAGGVVHSIKITVMFVDPAHSGNPTVNFGPHTYLNWSEAVNAGNFNKLNKSIVTTSQFVQTGGNFTRTISLPVSAWSGGQMGGVGIWGTATAANSARFAGDQTSNGVTAYTTQLELQVLK
jgi:hypothetical protein